MVCPGRQGDGPFVTFHLFPDRSQKPPCFLKPIAKNCRLRSGPGRCYPWNYGLAGLILAVALRPNRVVPKDEQGGSISVLDWFYLGIILSCRGLQWQTIYWNRLNTGGLFQTNIFIKQPAVISLNKTICCVKCILFFIFRCFRI